MSDIISFKNQGNDKIKLFLINNIVKSYNKCLYKYTLDFKGRLPAPKLDISKIPKKYMSLSEYLESKPVWKQIIRFTKEEKGINIDDYIDVMIRHWNDIIMAFNMKQKTPLSNIIFSTKMISMYDRFKTEDSEKDIINKNILNKKSDDFYRLTPTLKTNIDSLFKLKKLNPELSYKEIINIFSGEFEEIFVKAILDLDENEINYKKLSILFK